MILQKRVSALFCFVIFFLAALFLCSPRLCAAGFSAAFDLCRNSLLPALFPFFVLSRLLLDSPGAGLLAFGLRPICHALGLHSRSAPLLLLLGWLGGYTVLASALGEALRRNEVSRSEAEMLLVVGVVSSPGFSIGAVGSMLGSATVGAALYFSALLANLVCAAGFCVALRIFPSLRSEHAPHRPPHSEISLPDNAPFAGGIAAAISSAVQSSLAVCGCVIFYRMLLETACLLPLFRAPFHSAVLAAALEVCSGCSMLAGLGGRTGLYGCCAAASLLSLSVWSQLRLLIGARCSLAPLAVVRAAHLILSFLFLRLLLQFSRAVAPVYSTLAPRVIPLRRLAPDRAFLLFFVLCGVLELLHRITPLQQKPESL